MKYRLTFSRAALCLLSVIPALHSSAQPMEGPGLQGEVSAHYSYSADGDLDRNGKVGSVKIDHFGFDATTRIPVSADLKLMGGLAYSRDELSLTGNVPLPDR